VSSRRVKIPEAFRNAHRAARKAKWDVSFNEHSHLVWTSPSGEQVITPGTPRGGRRSALNSLHRLRKAGLEC
jgi:hypothetical protein